MSEGPRLTLVLGGARSGKSRHAEMLARKTGLRLIYLATAEAFDDEMRARIATHRDDRAAHGWTTIEEPIGLPAALARATSADAVVLIDCLTLWLSNLMLSDRDVPAMERAFLSVLAAAKGPVIMVSNEVGFGIVPDTSLGRRFRDVQGRLNQAVAEVVDHVVLVVAGLPLTLKAS